jgi:aminoglycoside phosphotransferase (APT) family kinase protein
MKENWEHKHTSSEASPALLKQMIQRAFPDQSIAQLQRTSTGLSNGSYKFTLEQNDRPYILRISSGSPEIASKEIAITQLVASTVPIARYLYSELHPSTEGPSWSILEWKEGILLADLLKTGDPNRIAAAGHAVGQVLAHIHQYTFVQAGFWGATLDHIVEPLTPGIEEWCAFVEDSLAHNRSGQWLQKEEIQAVQQFLQTSRERITYLQETPLLVHSDFNGLNILIDESSGSPSVSAVLDWEFAFAGTRYTDIGNMLRYESMDSTYEQHFLNGYRSGGGELHPEWRLLSRMEDLIALCDMLNHSDIHMPNRIADLRRLIVRTVTDL